jgi:hypothetical protein
VILAILRSRTGWMGAAFAVVSAVHLYIWGLIDLSPTIALVEAEWTLSALLGALYSADFVRDNVLDWQAFEADGDGDAGNQLTVEIMLLIGWVLLGLHLLLLTLGIFAMTRATSLDTAPTTRVIDAGFTVAGQALVGALALIRSKRARLRTYHPVEAI